MELSCKSEYAILALIELAARYQSGEPLQIRQIAAKQSIPDRYLEQLLATLRRGGLVKSQRGSKGGYLLTREPWKIKVFDILVCLEGVDKLKKCDEDTQLKTLESIIVEEIWQEACLAANSVLQNYTLADLCDRRDSHKQTDIMYYI
ncbi:MAG: Rrf2 family transcriptional regulator [Cyanobacteria bacterium P01_A01_bin.84]